RARMTSMRDPATGTGVGHRENWDICMCGMGATLIESADRARLRIQALKRRDYELRSLAWEG
ncbi:MAG TPA: hypothetical protein VKT00_01135, partial [Casimicrobiaceae bacterium]|nr:hypothetical protein [Casimicrobiaceae bacterium]